MDDSPERKCLRQLTLTIAKNVNALNALLQEQSSQDRDNRMRACVNQLEIHNFDAMRFGLNLSADYIARLKTGRLPKTSKPKEKQSKPKPPSDERSKHPAIQAFRSLRGKYPNKDVWDLVISVLGAEPDVIRLKRCWLAWRAKNFSSENLGWLVDWYVNGVPANGHTANVSKADLSVQAGMEVIAELEAKLERERNGSRT